MDTTKKVPTDILDVDYYVIAGAGGDVAEWVDGYVNLMGPTGTNVGTPSKWFEFTGAEFNAAVITAKGQIKPADLFPADLTILAFPLEGLHIGRLSMLKLRLEDRWSTDIYANMASI